MAGERLVAIVGAGSIGTGWAIVFARAGWRVSLYDPVVGQLDAARQEIATRTTRLERFGLISEGGCGLLERIEMTTDLAVAASDCAYVQECAPENPALKRDLFAALIEAAPADAVLASSTSAIAPSSLFLGLNGVERCLVAHPVNPPYLLAVVEVVPSAETSKATLARTVELLADVGMNPITVNSEVEGFVVNRLQGAILREAYCLFRDGVASLDDIDRAVREGLGRRWAVTGPFETADLNVRGGIAAHAERMGPAYERMGAERGQHDPWTPELVAAAAGVRRELLPLQEWEQRVVWRDEQLMRQEYEGMSTRECEVGRT